MAQAWAISSADHQPLHGTAIAPTARMAKNIATHSGLLAAKMPTRSPPRTPSWRRRRVNVRIIRSCSAKEITRAPWMMNGRSDHRRASSRTAVILAGRGK